MLTTSDTYIRETLVWILQ